MNHEIPFVCPACGEEYDAHLHWHICPKCGTDADREIVAEKRYAIANFATKRTSNKHKYMALIVLAILAWRGFGWAFIAEVVVLGIATVAEILVALSIAAIDRDHGGRRKK